MSPAWTMRPLSITATKSPTSRATRKFCSTSRIVAPRCLMSFRQAIRPSMIAGARPLVGSSISSSARGSIERAGDREHLLLAARQRARAREPEFFQRGKEAEDPVEPRLVHRAAARGEQQIFAHAEVGEDRHRLRHVGDAGARDVARARASRRRSPSRIAPREARHRPMMVRRHVVLPAPLRPSSMVVRPAGASKSTPCRM